MEKNNTDNIEPDNESRFSKITRSLSMRLMGKHSKERTPNENPRKNSGPIPKKLDADNWVKKTTRDTIQTGPRPAKPKNGMVGEKMSMWVNKQKQHEEKQALNPFSEHFDKSKVITMDKNDPNYGRPPEDSLTAARARAGEARLMQEIVDVCHVIFVQGTKMGDGTAAITFGQLFQIYNSINDKVVGLLLRARKKGLLTFEGEMLFQRRDDDKWIELTKTINTIHKIHGRDPNVVGGGEVDVDSEDEDPKVSAKTISASTAGPSVPFARQTSQKDSPKPSEKASASPDVSNSTKKKAVNSIKSSFRKMARPFVKKRMEEGKEGSTDDEEAWGESSRRGSRRGSRKSIEKLPRSKGVLGRLTNQENNSDSSGEFVASRLKDQASPSQSQQSRKRFTIRRGSLF